MTKLYIGVIIEPHPERISIIQTSTSRADMPTIARGSIVHVLEVDVPPEMLTTHIKKQVVGAGGVGIKL